MNTVPYIDQKSQARSEFVHRCTCIQNRPERICYKHSIQGHKTQNLKDCFKQLITQGILLLRAQFCCCCCFIKATQSYLLGKLYPYSIKSHIFFGTWYPVYTKTVHIF